MQKTPRRIASGKGLDVGTAFIYCAEKQGDKITFRTQRDAFFDIEYSDFTKEMLTKSKVNYIQKEEKLYVVGDEAIKFANIFNKNARRPLSKGIISPSEREALSMVELIIKSVMGEPKYEREIVYYSIPGPPVDADFNVVYHEKVINSFLVKFGYTPKSMNEGLAVVFSELDKDGFTGIGLSFGGGMVNMCLSYMSVPIFTFSVTKAGDWIDEQVAVAVDETASRICAIKESSLNLTKDVGLSKIETALSIYYNNLIEYVLENIKREFGRTKRMPRIDKPITIVLSGGSAIPKGFIDRFKAILGKVKFPIEVGQVRMASEPQYSVAKGALIAAMAEEEKGAG
ncbi:hypothetical protein HQ584_02610 [Patescibacteria group bacterium]|nr:hypothetical protein [Patescibacteria group bacterium]